MKASWVVVALLAPSTPVYAQTVPAPVMPPVVMPPVPTDAAAPGIPDDLNLLAGKKVIVGRMPLCVPNTYSVNMTYGGKLATVISYAPNAVLARSAASLSRFPPNMRATMDDARHGGRLTFRFEDGTVLDTCGDLTLSQLAPNMQLAPGETIALPVMPSGALTATGPATPPQQCPLTVVGLSSGLGFGHALVDALTSSELEPQIDSAQNGGAGKNYLDVRLHNDGQKSIKAFEYTAVYRNSMGDETTSPTYLSQNTQPIKPGALYKAYAMDRVERSQNGVGDVKVYISRIRFDDDTMWEDNGSHSCFKTVTSK
ncbi:hypothetical protein [Sphingomonas asaccharolytica]|uniref:hypothetical protein n=1 Tax=Sphingomonas asaccharolytica TaxID=40681 RepID=UPI000A6BD69D|nr:hypothetical protein [Sphingomonas asaccharolytica]